jgi:hypothetical protein
MRPIGPTIFRRQCLALARIILIGSGVAGLVTQPSVRANAKADKRDFFYQEKPKDGKSCESCRMFSLATGGTGMCAIVDGNVSPKGWCLAYSPRASS